MSTTGTIEHTLLELRVRELERRLSELERRIAEAPPSTPEPNGEPLVSPVAALETEDAVAAVEPEGEADRPAEGEPEGQLEGARLVAIELLSAGYAHRDVVDYLRSTFGVSNADAMIAGAGAVPG